MQIINPKILASVAALNDAFTNARPFKHVIIDNFFSEDVLPGLLEEFPARATAKGLKTEYGGIAIKSARSDVRNFGETYRTLDKYIASPDFTAFMEGITGFEGLTPDPLYDGAGIHENFAGNRGFIHVDFNFHRVTGQHRRLNAIVYLTPGWNPEWGGAINLYEDGWNPETGLSVKVPCLFNRCILFETNEISWHGVDTVAFPDGTPPQTRKSFTIYMYSETRPQNEIGIPHETVYVPGKRPDCLLQKKKQLDEQDLSDLNQYINGAKGLIKNLYDREKRFSKTISSQKARLNHLRQSYRLPVVGDAKMLAQEGFDLDDWLCGSGSVSLETVNHATGIEISAVYPKTFPLPATVEARINSLPSVKLLIKESGKFQLWLPKDLPVGGKVELKMECDKSYSSSELGIGDSTRKRSFLIKEIRVK
jgi:hypothetical protein